MPLAGVVRNIILGEKVIQDPPLPTANGYTGLTDPSPWLAKSKMVCGRRHIDFLSAWNSFVRKPAQNNAIISTTEQLQSFKFPVLIVYDEDYASRRFP